MDQFLILVSGQDVVKLLAVSKLLDRIGASMAQGITQTIDDWGLQDRIKGLFFDTTSSNTGIKGGACIYSEAELGWQLINLASHHCTPENILEKAFSIHDISRSPNMELFGQFKDFWPCLTRTHFVQQLKITL